jgi:hypothetical protein
MALSGQNFAKLAVKSANKKPFSMKQFLSVGLALMLFAGSLLPPMSAEQAVRLPELLTHYHQHEREEGQPLTFWSFLTEHYLPDSQHCKAPKHSHNRLPSFDGGGSAYDFVPLVFLTCSEPFAVERLSVAMFRLRLMNARQVFTSLLQPPRHQA